MQGASVLAAAMEGAKLSSTQRGTPAAPFTELHRQEEHTQATPQETSEVQGLRLAVAGSVASAVHTVGTFIITIVTILFGLFCGWPTHGPSSSRQRQIAAVQVQLVACCLLVVCCYFAVGCLLRRGWAAFHPGHELK